MKGTFFAKPLEYNLNIDGESWTQGSSIVGTLSVTSHGEVTDLSRVGVHLCYCTSKKLKAKDPSGITLIESFLLTQDCNDLAFEFKLDEACAISESSGGHYILCGDLNRPFDGGMLELSVGPAKTISSFVEVFEQFFRFKLKKYKSKKGFIEAGVTPPSSSDWSRIQKMVLQLRIVEKSLEVKFLFSLKNATFQSATDKTSDEKLEIIKVLTEREYSLYGSTNQDGIRKVIEEVLEQVKLKPIL